jgi:hypothetical protein
MYPLYGTRIQVDCSTRITPTPFVVCDYMLEKKIRCCQQRFATVIPTTMMANKFSILANGNNSSFLIATVAIQESSLIK